MLVREIILENFMSYEYARIPLRSGVNIVCGPNGSGKSSILLGISVALGQSYTERSRKLSDLIRWGKDTGRVTLLLDNAKRGSRRPVPKFNKDEIPLTRILRRDGRYWFELDNRPVNRSDVVRLLSKLGVDPDNLLIIMHQNMAEQFVILSPQERLRMVEAAVGLEPYRKHVLDAKRKLSRIMSQEESISKLLASAEQTLKYWREQYDRYQLKKQLFLKKRFLERELAWAEVTRREEEVEHLRSERDWLMKDIREIRRKISQLEDQASQLGKFIDMQRKELEGEYKKRVKLEGEKGALEASIVLTEEIISDLSLCVDMQKIVTEFISEIAGVSDDGFFYENEMKHKRLISQLQDLNERSLLKLTTSIERLKNKGNSASKRLAEISLMINETQNRINKIHSSTDDLFNDLIEKKVNLSLLHYKIDDLTKRLALTEDDLKKRLRSLESEKQRAAEFGPRIAVVRSPDGILAEIRETDGRIAALADVSEDVEKMYNSYSKLYLELKEKSKKVAENRERALKEVEARMNAWRTVIKKLLGQVDMEYKRILSYADAFGSVRILDEHDIEAAGLEIIVGFKGADPVPLNAYTQSGGERSTATMAFLLALQRHVKSPFRAIDEYDIHMDPRNREIMANLLISSLEGQDVQYLIITPNPIYLEERNIHVITVQNIGGSSIIKETA